MFGLWNKLFSKKPEEIKASLNYPCSTLGCMFDETASRYANNLAISFSGVDFTYNSLHESTNRLAAGMARLGIKTGEKVLFTLPNCPEFIMAFMAVQKLGGVVVNAGPLMGVVDLKELVELTKPKVIVALDLQSENLKDIATEQDELHWLWVSLKHYQNLWRKVGYSFKTWGGGISKTQHQITFDELMKQSSSRPPTMPVAITDTAVLQPTGGTTGVLKVAELTHANLMANAMQTSNWARFRQGQEVILGILPMFHVYGLSTCIVAPIFNGGHLVPMLRFKLDQFIDIILQYRPTMIPLVPAIADAMNKELEKNKKLKIKVVEAMKESVVISGAVPLRPNTYHKFKTITGKHIVQGYGLTEASPVTHINPIEAPKPGVVGIPLPNTSVKVVKINDPTVDAVDEPGELLLRGPQVMKGYYRNPEETTKMFVKINGCSWLRTGDIVTVDKDGYCKLVDRKKDMINRGGMKIWPQKVEAVLITHGNVLSVLYLYCSKASCALASLIQN